jgi:hypothetical protein
MMIEDQIILEEMIIEDLKEEQHLKVIDQDNK